MFSTAPLPAVSREFDRFRKLRNGMNYYGRQLDVDFVRKSLEEMRAIESRLKHLMVVKYAVLKDALVSL